MDDFGKYTLVKRLAVGGMAEVYLATSRDVKDAGRLLVIKRILPNLAEDAHFITMFLNEARIASQLNHPNIVRLFDLGKEGGSYFLAMEYIHGEDLGALAEAVRAKGRLLPIPMVLRVVSEACKGLHYAHTMRDLQGQPLKLVHRDISPQNLMVGFNGDLKILDFGIARAANQASTTQTGEIKGKYSYIPPEQAKGMDLDCRSDVFSLGIVLYELLTGTNPLKRDNELITLRAAIDCDIPPISSVADIPDSVAALVGKAICKGRDGRFSSALEFHQAIAPLIAGDPLASLEKLATAMKCLFFRRYCKEGENGSNDSEFSLDGFSLPSKNELEAEIGLSGWPSSFAGKRATGGSASLTGEWDIVEPTLSNGGREAPSTKDETTSVAFPGGGQESEGLSTVEFQKSFISPAPDDPAIRRMLSNQDASAHGEEDDEVTCVTEPNGRTIQEMPSTAQRPSVKDRTGPLPRMAPRPRPIVHGDSLPPRRKPSLPPLRRVSSAGEDKPSPLQPHHRRSLKLSLPERPSGQAASSLRHTMVDKAFQHTNRPDFGSEVPRASLVPKPRLSSGPKGATARDADAIHSPPEVGARPQEIAPRSKPSTKLRGDDIPASRPTEVIASLKAGAPASQVAEISESQIAEISESQIAEISGSQVAEISESQVIEISGSQIAEISESQIAEISESQIAEISESQIAEISESQVVDLSPNACPRTDIPVPNASACSPSDAHASGSPDDFDHGEKTAAADIGDLIGHEETQSGRLPNAAAHADAPPKATFHDDSAEEEEDDDEKTVSARGPDSRFESRRADFARRAASSPTSDGFLPHFTEEEVSAVITAADRRPADTSDSWGKHGEGTQPEISLPRLGDSSSPDELSQQTSPQRLRNGRPSPKPRQPPAAESLADYIDQGMEEENEATPVAFSRPPRKQPSGGSLEDFINRERRSRGSPDIQPLQDGDEDTESHSEAFPRGKRDSVESGRKGGGIATPDSRPVAIGLSVQSMPSIVRDVRIRLDKCLDELDGYRKSKGLGWDTVLVMGIVAVILLLLLLLIIFL